MTQKLSGAPSSSPRPPGATAALVLSDSTVLWGKGLGGAGSMVGEVVFKVMSASFTSTVSVVAPGDIGTLMFAILATSTVISVLTVLNAGASTVTE